MRSLFIKIFLWFWVAMALISFASFLSAVATESHPFFAMPWLRFLVRPPIEGHLKMQSGSFTGHWISVAGNSLRLAGQTAVEIYERDGKTGLSDYLNELERAVHIQFFLFDEQNGAANRMADSRRGKRIIFASTDAMVWISSDPVSRFLRLNGSPVQAAKRIP